MAARRKIIAVVEDDLSMLKGVRRLLTQYGYETEAFTSGEACLAGAATSKAGCLLVDIHLGDMSGTEMYRRLQDMGSQIPAIFMTAVDDEEKRKEAMDLSCIAYLRKPFPASQLIEAIRKGLP